MEAIALEATAIRLNITMAIEATIFIIISRVFQPGKVTVATQRA
jgi:hypothetical protein